MDRKQWRVYSIHGDGELQEGSIWEAAMSAAHHKLDNLTALVDRNGVQIDGKTSEVMELEPLDSKWKAFGWHVILCNGHDHRELINAYHRAKRTKGKPTVILAQTIMGKGVPSIEGDYLWHGKTPTKEQSIQFLNELY
jgi:transketolase